MVFNKGISQDVLGGACWDEAEDDQQYPNRLVRVLSRLRKWLNARSEVEDVNEQDLEVEPAKIHTHISTEEKSVAATDHRRLVSTLDTTCIKAYTDGSLLKGKVGTGVYVVVVSQFIDLQPLRLWPVNVQDTTEVGGRVSRKQNQQKGDPPPVLPPQAAENPRANKEIQIAESHQSQISNK